LWFAGIALIAVQDLPEAAVDVSESGFDPKAFRWARELDGEFRGDSESALLSHESILAIDPIRRTERRDCFRQRDRPQHAVAPMNSDQDPAVLHG
jgi:hypothetical protein